jgi:hypothetical protein
VSLRVWTAEELARVWPLPGDWVWHSEPGMDWFALHTPSMVMVFVDADGLLVTTSEAEPVAVALAVIGAHQGRDSVETLAREMDDRDRELGKVAIAEDHEQDREGACIAAGEALGFRRSAAMLRRGTVAP